MGLNVSRIEAPHDFIRIPSADDSKTTKKKNSHFKKSLCLYQLQTKYIQTLSNSPWYTAIALTGRSIIKLL